MVQTNDSFKTGNQSSNEMNKTNHPPSISLPKGGGAIRGIGEKFAANPVTGTGTLTVPIPTSPGRSGFGPQLSLTYDSGAGNGPFGFGWNLSLPSITRKTEKGLPKYQDSEDSDIFILMGAEDLVPLLKKDKQGKWLPMEVPPRTVNGISYSIRSYLPRVEGLFSTIERWTNVTKLEDIFWRTISKDNITTWYGKSENSRIADPENPEHIFSWLISECHDDKGNIIAYHYKSEDANNVDLSLPHQQNRGGRNDKRRTANRYIKRILYGNHKPFLPKLKADKPWADLPNINNWYFEVVFDYGEHNEKNPTPQETDQWLSRQDAFSSYRSGFEVRTNRLCRQVLMFHHIPDHHCSDSQKGYDGLVRSTNFTYEYKNNDLDYSTPIYSKLIKVTQCSSQLTDSGYLFRPYPPVEFSYSEAKIQTELRELLDEDSLANLPIGIDGSLYQWVDLDGEGLSGVLTEQGDKWLYKRNLSPINVIVSDKDKHIEAKFAPVEIVSTIPGMSITKQAQFLDLAGDGRPDVVQFKGSVPGFYERTMDEKWESFVPFSSMPNVDWDDPNLKFIDLDGDGRSDILISEDNAFVWYQSLGETGFDAGQRTSRSWDEEKGPHFIFANKKQAIFLSDMSGDGLNDIVRIRHSEVCYWPNLGYGRFGAKITMDNPPCFDLEEKCDATVPPLDYVDEFDPSRIRLADIDGTGTTDILYLHRNGVRVYFNQSGNSWSHGTPINNFPALSNFVHVQVLDLLGNGTACLVWSSPLPSDSHCPVRYLDLMGGQKPHLLIKVRNNLGAETTIGYAPSTKFYLQDKLEGKPWITKLPFPVHCVEKVTVHDKWRKTTFSTSYSYHHGYYDGQEREFRGFGRVEQIDVEDYGLFAKDYKSSPYITDDQTLFQPPVKTVKWYHTGVLDFERPLGLYKNEYFPNWFAAEKPGKQVLGTFQEKDLTEFDLHALDLPSDEWREALRSCKGLILRQEVYELDVDNLARNIHKPVKLFSASNRSFHIQCQQPKAVNPHAVFLVTESEAIIYHYELELVPEQLTPDPRIVQKLNLKIDEYGNIQQSVTVVYPRIRKFVDSTLNSGTVELIQKLQSEIHVSYTETHYTNDVPISENKDLDNYRLRLPCEVLNYELTGNLMDEKKTPNDENTHQIRYFTQDKLRSYKLSDVYQKCGFPVDEIPYHQQPTGLTPQKRIVEHVRTLFFSESLDQPMALGQVNALALPYETYKLALTDDILEMVFKDKINQEIKEALNDRNKSGYLTGADLAIFGTDKTREYWIRSGVAGFKPDAPLHFFLPVLYTDPFGNETTLDYDCPGYLYLKSSTDALGNRTEVTKYDFRILAPCVMKDSNDNISQVRFDILGMPAAMALMGKGTEADNLSAFDDKLLNPNLETLENFFVNNDYNANNAKNLLGGASTRHLYYFGEQIINGQTVWGQHPACACGIKRERHVIEEPNSPVQCGFEYSDGMGTVIVTKVQAEPDQADSPLRWVASGKVILNNKGKVVKQYEPYFSSPSVGHRFEEPIEVGVTTVIYYDAADRVIRTEMPDGSYSRIEFSPWRSTHYDANDTIKEAGNVWYMRKNMPDSPEEDKRAARLAAEHVDTPSVIVLDTLGREVLNIAHNRMGTLDQKYVTFTRLDAEGKPLWVQDSRGNRVMQYIMPPLPDGTQPFNDSNNLNPQGVVPCYDIAGNLLYQHSMDAGDRWILTDAAGKPMFKWDSRSFLTGMTYDKLHRPTGSFVTGADQVNPKRKIQFEKMVYGEGQVDDKQHNLRGKLFEHFDSAGVVTNEVYDFKGNLLRTKRQLLADYKVIPDWAQGSTIPGLELELFVSKTSYDALNRPIQIIAPYSLTANPKHINITQPTYNLSGFLKGVAVWLNQNTEPLTLLDVSSASQHPVKNLKYNAKGQRIEVQYGNGSETRYEYEKETFRLKQLKTKRMIDGVLLQNLTYTYDPVGNITQIQDSAQDNVFHSNKCVKPGAKYRYDALYRLNAASGREHKGKGQQYNGDDYSHYVTTLPNEGQALQNYVEYYRYDEVGNILELKHHEGYELENPGQVIWSRRYQYALTSNRLLATNLPGDPANLPDYISNPGYSEKYTYDQNGNITSMSHLPKMDWDFQDQLSTITRMSVNDSTPPVQVPVTTYYIYDSSGQRVRKITETQTGAICKQRIYLGGFEVYREYSNGVVILERETLHVMDDKQRLALIETQTIKNKLTITSPMPLVRYQLGNHLDSVSLELDESAAVITYEEYTPYGSTAYCAGRSGAEVSMKRYRYTGKERDDETGFSYHGARYYMPWLGRWISYDPLIFHEIRHSYSFVVNNPIKFFDPSGADEKQPPAIGGHTMPPNRGDLGTLIHNVVLHTLQLRLAVLGVTSLIERETEPDGSKNLNSEKPGRVDLALLLPDVQKPNQVRAQLYELKPRVPEKYEDYRSEVEHYTEYFPKKVDGKSVSDVKAGTALNVAEKGIPQLFDPIQISNSSIEVTINIGLAHDNNNHPIPGLIVYDVGVRQKRPGEDNSVERVKEMLKTNINQTADAQAHGMARMSIAAGGSINTLNALSQVLVLGGGIILAGSGTGGASATGVTAGTSTGTAATGTGGTGSASTGVVSTGVRVASRVRIAEGVGEATRIRVATEIQEEIVQESTEVLKRMVIQR